ncbi:TadE/TadG family type IV pilus assembly protein [Basilea psittacipulmonis]|uniref:Uncharacterized protein n=1 Tax=Basilea psittacipulmonis DSM 24701 TaxID=1072685 RepID=A0A077DGY1_9BURK|nr:TadE family protein [Basilea psittacipulmonis]AIL32438.1 hypothetical protein IX83_03155 [Basilea psittacipulmonis DSM 24701]
MDIFIQNRTLNDESGQAMIETIVIFVLFISIFYALVFLGRISYFWVKEASILNYQTVMSAYHASDAHRSEERKYLLSEHEHNYLKRQYNKVNETYRLSALDFPVLSNKDAKRSILAKDWEVDQKMVHLSKVGNFWNIPWEKERFVVPEYGQVPFTANQMVKSSWGWKKPNGLSRSITNISKVWANTIDKPWLRANMVNDWVFIWQDKL